MTNRGMERELKEIFPKQVEGHGLEIWGGSGEQTKLSAAPAQIAGARLLVADVVYTPSAQQA